MHRTEVVGVYKGVSADLCGTQSRRHQRICVALYRLFGQGRVRLHRWTLPRVSLTSRILLAMAAGILLGSLLNLLVHFDLAPRLLATINTYLIGGLFDVVGRIFVASLKLLVVPLVLVSLICGSSSLGNSSRMGPIAGKTMLFYLATTAIAVTAALMAAVFIGPGEGVNLASDTKFLATEPPPLTDVLVNIFPTNPVQAMAEGKMLQIIVFALLFGYAISHAGEPGQRIASFFRDMESVVMKMVDVLMHLAPYGVFALLAKLFATMGIGAILDLATYFFTVLAVLLFHVLVTYSLLLKGLTGLSPRILLSKMRPVWAFAFSTASSGATLPITLRTVEHRMGVHNSVAGFTVPLGLRSIWTGPRLCREWLPFLLPRCMAWICPWARISPW